MCWRIDCRLTRQELFCWAGRTARRITISVDFALQEVSVVFLALPLANHTCAEYISCCVSEWAGKQRLQSALKPQRIGVA